MTDVTDIRDSYRDETGKSTMVDDSVIEPHYTVDYVRWLEQKVLEYAQRDGKKIPVSKNDNG